jgi:hypothetical protein
VKAGLADAPPDTPEAELAMARTMFQQMGEVVARQCGEDKWPQPVVDCMATSATIEECDALMSPELKQRLEDVLAKQLALTAGPAGDVAGAPAAGGAAAPVAATGIAECDQLMATFSKLLSCDKLPEMMKGQFDQLRATMAQGLGMIQMVPADQRGAIVDGCKQGLAQLQDAAKQTGCAL